MDKKSVTIHKIEYENSLPCPNCHCEKNKILIGDWPGNHYAKVVCDNCLRYVKWLSKPNNLKSKRIKSHRDLVKKYNQDYCELCLRKQSELPLKQTLEAHHIIPYKENSSEEFSQRQNIWIVCTSCHKLIHHQRTYKG